MKTEISLTRQKNTSYTWLCLAGDAEYIISDVRVNITRFSLSLEGIFTYINLINIILKASTKYYKKFDAYITLCQSNSYIIRMHCYSIYNYSILLKR